ncbi:MAG: uracil phosphoribosyltransferase [Omnitrophica WOR_2 bacterium RBG_13_44_8]|nr:MAG: uracil phosphoribosyltransferase [Omnitrophica WOR_2 bacterium RBG_13_44_8]
MKVTEIRHPIVSHKLAMIRDMNTDTKQFRELVKEISGILAYEAMRNLPRRSVKVETPFMEVEVDKIDLKKVVIVSVQRAGTGMVDGILEMLPSLAVGQIGMYRDEETLKPVEYYVKLPKNIEGATVFLVDPMLATGGSAAASLDLIKKHNPDSITLLSIISAPEGIKKINELHPDVVIYTCAVDSHLNDIGYIVPGLGDAGDRMFGT